MGTRGKENHRANSLGRIAGAAKGLVHAAASFRHAVNRQAYRRFAGTCPIAERTVLLDQQHGTSCDGNIFAIARHLSSDERTRDLHLYFTVSRRERERMTKLIETRQLPVSPVVTGTRRYYKLLATSRYLIADTSFSDCLVKRSGQTLWNTWHGTPLKTLGRRERRESHLIGNVQKNFVAADYLSFPNSFTARHIVDDYMLANASHATQLFAEYPRNQAFAHEPSPATRSRFIPDHATAYAYLPTFRFAGESQAKNAAIDTIVEYLRALDSLLGEHEVLYVKLHPAIGTQVNLGGFKHIRTMPTGIELYEFLNLCDALITDYSSVMFDFAITGKRIVLFTFDAESYLQERGLYLSLDALPFPRARTAEELVAELRGPHAARYDSGLDEFLVYDCATATESLCDRVLLDERGRVKEAPLPSNQMPNLLVYLDELPDEAGFRKLVAFAGALGNDSNVFLAFRGEQAQERPELLAIIPDTIGFIPLSGDMILFAREKLARKALSAGLLSFNRYDHAIAPALAFEVQRTLCDIRFSDVVCIALNDWKAAHLASKVPASRHALLMGKRALENAPRGFDAYLDAAYGSIALIESAEAL